MSVSFVNLHGLSIQITRIRSNIPSSANGLTLVDANTNSQTHRTKHRPAVDDALFGKKLSTIRLEVTRSLTCPTFYVQWNFQFHRKPTFR